MSCPQQPSTVFVILCAGTLELVVTTAKTSVRAEVQARSRGLYDVTFVPQELSPHFVNITFNDQEIENSPFQCKIVDERGGGGKDDGSGSGVASGPGVTSGPGVDSGVGSGGGDASSSDGSGAGGARRGGPIPRTP